MKKFLKFIFIIGPCFFIYCMNTNAYSVGLDMEKPMNTILYDHSGTSSFSILESDRILDPDNQFLGYANVSIFNPGQYGFSTSFCGPQFVKDNYYSVSIYYLDQRHKGYLHPRYVNYSSLVGIGTTQYNAMAYSNISDLTINTNNTYVKAPDINDNFKDVWLGSVSYVFKANQTSNCMRFSLSSETNQTKYTLGDYIFLGYRLESQGNKPLSSSDIQDIFTNDFNNLNESLESTKNDINNNINNSTNDINNNINNATNSINNAIDVMKDSVNESINSDDEDTLSGKCGIVCKLKGIWNGIVNLPQHIWNFLKQGFDSITDIFKPEEKCEVSKNLFNFKQDYNKTHSSSSNILLYEKLDNGFRLTSKSSTNTLKIIYDLGSVIKFDGTTLNLSANVTSGGHLQIGYRYYKSPSNYYVYDSSNHYFNSHSLTIDSNKTDGLGNAVLYFFVEPGQSVEFTDIMLNEGNEVLPYEPYGEETCTGGGSFFDWFGNFFKSIVNGILELPGKLVSLLLEGLKSLFVPTDAQLLDIVEESKSLTENFGFVGESMNFFLTIFTSLLGLVNQNGCIQLPEFSIGSTSLFEAHTFWESQLVCLSDNAILSSNINTIRTITSIVLVTLFINFAVSKFFGILSKNDSGSTTTYNDDGTSTTSDWSVVNGDRSIYRRKT